MTTSPVFSVTEMSTSFSLLVIASEKVSVMLIVSPRLYSPLPVVEEMLAMVGAITSIMRVSWTAREEADGDTGTVKMASFPEPSRMVDPTGKEKADVLARSRSAVS